MPSPSPCLVLCALVGIFTQVLSWRIVPIPPPLSRSARTTCYSESVVSRRNLFIAGGGSLALAKIPIEGTFYVPKNDLSGKTVLITGGNTGLGFESAKRLAAAGATVVITSRDVVKGRDAVRRIQEITGRSDVDVLPLDLASLESVRNCVREFKNKYSSLNCLMLNAGVMAIPERRLTTDGFEMQMGVNHLGHFALASGLMSILLATPGVARVVSVSSAAHFGANTIDLAEDLRRFDGATDPSAAEYSQWGCYCKSKLANVLFAKEFQRRLAAAGTTTVEVMSLHPGAVRTELGRYLIDGAPVPVLALFAPLGFYITRSVERGASTQVFLAAEPTLPPLAKGGYFDDCKLAFTNPVADDVELGRKLWEASEDLTGGKVLFN